MVNCATCRDPVTIPFKCKYCGETFCHKHRLRELHDCRGYSRSFPEYTMSADYTASVPRQDDARISNATAGYNYDKIVAPQFDDDDDEASMSIRPAIGNAIYYGLTIFFIFAVLDVIGLLFPGGLLNLAGIIIHVAFLPPLLVLASKIKKGEYNKETLELYGKLNLNYIAFYMVTKIGISILRGDIIGVFIFLFIGTQVLLSWIRFRAMFKMMSRNENGGE